MTFKLAAAFPAADRTATAWMARHGANILRTALGIVFLWFGILKLFPGMSPAAALATRTVSTITLGLVPPAVSLPMLGALECVIGLGLLAGKALRMTLLLLGLQMAGTLLPLVLFPDVTWVHVPYAPTIEGEFIIKNLVLISAALVLGATVRGGKLVADPEAAHLGERLTGRAPI